MSIRDVRPTDDFHRDVDQALVLAGSPMSRSEFGLYVLSGILGRFATGWDRLPMPIPGRSDYRILIGYSGHLGAYAVEGQVAWDDVIELTSLTVDATGPDLAESLRDDEDRRRGADRLCRVGVVLM